MIENTEKLKILLQELFFGKNSSKYIAKGQYGIFEKDIHKIMKAVNLKPKKNTDVKLLFKKLFLFHGYINSLADDLYFLLTTYKIQDTRDYTQTLANKAILNEIMKGFDKTPGRFTYSLIMIISDIKTVLGIDYTIASENKMYNFRNKAINHLDTRFNEDLRGIQKDFGNYSSYITHYIHLKKALNDLLKHLGITNAIYVNSFDKYLIDNIDIYFPFEDQKIYYLNILQMEFNDSITIVLQSYKKQSLIILNKEGI